MGYYIVSVHIEHNKKKRPLEFSLFLVKTHKIRYTHTHTLQSAVVGEWMEKRAPTKRIRRENGERERKKTTTFTFEVEVSRVD